MEETRTNLRETETTISKIQTRQIKYKLIAEGDKITPFFLNRIKGQKHKGIEEMQLDPEDPESVTNNKNSIKKHIIEHFTKTMEAEEETTETLENFMEKYEINLPKISTEARTAIEAKPSKEEVLRAVEHLNNNSASGLDGITSRLVKFLATLMLDRKYTAISKEVDGREGKTLITRMR